MTKWKSSIICGTGTGMISGGTSQKKQELPHFTLGSRFYWESPLPFEPSENRTVL